MTVAVQAATMHQCTQGKCAHRYRYLAIRIVMLLVGLMSRRVSALVFNNQTLRTVVSMTTSPKRIETIGKTLQSILTQPLLPDSIQINLPRVFRRYNTSFAPIEQYSVLQHPLIRIHQCDDFGPATKLIPTLETETDPNTLIIIIDDDIVYPAHFITSMVEKSLFDPTWVQAGRCGDPLLSNPEQDFWRQPFSDAIRPSGHGGWCCCRMYEGFAGVGYRRFMFSNATIPFDEFMKRALSNPACFRSDDLVISSYLSLLGIQGMDLRLRGIWSQPIGEESDGLHKQPGGHPYPDCSRFLQKSKMSYLRVWNDIIPTASPAASPDASRVTNVDVDWPIRRKKRK
jgi:hypothetical protein